jgi:hypothetical protein
MNIMHQSLSYVYLAFPRRPPDKTARVTYISKDINFILPFTTSLSLITPRSRRLPQTLSNPQRQPHHHQNAPSPPLPHLPPPPHYRLRNPLLHLRKMHRRIKRVRRQPHKRVSRNPLGRTTGALINPWTSEEDNKLILATYSDASCCHANLVQMLGWDDDCVALKGGVKSFRALDPEEPDKEREGESYVC